ncbi:MAG: DUF4153 domain-containing protein [Caulobacter sp.]|nr:DUF4153 domain-containing protein [Caulobacter sp.]
MTDAAQTRVPGTLAPEDHDLRAVRRAAVIRLVTGLAQGLLLYALNRANDAEVWPATSPELFVAIAMAVLFAPFVALAGVSALRWRTLAAWKAVSVLVASGLGVYAIWSRDPAVAKSASAGPDGPVVFAVAALLFIGHHLVQPADMERRPIARYATYFDVTWKHGVQMVLSLLFTGAFWLVLFLAATLFKLIGIKAIEALIQNQAFAFPATTTMFAAAVQLTDVRANLVRGVRTVALTLLAWLLPLMVLIGAGFLLTLPFTGLEMLWGTRSATASLLTAAAFLIVLTNAAYQEGAEPPPAVLRWAARLAGVLLAPITLLAAYGLALRIGQYGLSGDRIAAVACVLVAAGYAVGYALAALRRGAWMATLEPTNIVMAVVSVVVLLGLFTPLADPRRLAVGDQVDRLRHGRVAVDRFDFEYLRFDAGRYGRAALARLAKDPNPKIAEQARAVAGQAWRSTSGHDQAPEARAARIVFHPAGATPPPGFMASTTEGAFSLCFDAREPCDARVMDVTGDHRPEVVMTSGAQIELFGQDGDGRWRKLGDFNRRCGDFDLRAAVRDGTLSLAEPAIKDLSTPAGHLEFSPAATGCPREVRPLQTLH